jgi:hypothetical protein
MLNATLQNILKIIYSARRIMLMMMRRADGGNKKFSVHADLREAGEYLLRYSSDKIPVFSKDTSLPVVPVSKIAKFEILSGVLVGGGGRGGNGFTWAQSGENAEGGDGGGSGNQTTLVSSTSTGISQLSITVGSGATQSAVSAASKISINNNPFRQADGGTNGNDGNQSRVHIPGTGAYTGGTGIGDHGQDIDGLGGGGAGYSGNGENPEGWWQSAPTNGGPGLGWNNGQKASGSFYNYDSNGGSGPGGGGGGAGASTTSSWVAGIGGDGGAGWAHIFYKVTLR